MSWATILPLKKLRRISTMCVVSSIILFVFCVSGYHIIKGETWTNNANPYLRIETNETYSRHMLEVLPVNVYDYNYIIDNPNICKKNFKILILVKSGAQNLRRRTKVRNIWGKPSANHRVIFVVGKKTKIINDAIVRENEIYHDILQIDKEDTYANLATKDMMAFKWTIENCKNINYVALVDDDAVLFIDNIIDFYNSSNIIKEGRFFGGHIMPRSPTIRNATHKSYIPFEEVPGKYFTPYISGQCIFFTMDTIREIFNASAYVKHIRIDDAYLGLVAQTVNITPYNIKNKIIVKKQKNKIPTDSMLCMKIRRAKKLNDR